MGIEMVTNLIGRCALYEELYPGSSRVNAELVPLYAQILIYLVAAKRFYSRSTTGKTFSDFQCEGRHILERDDPVPATSSLPVPVP